jgi:hypothetical protein
MQQPHYKTQYKTEYPQQVIDGDEQRVIQKIRENHLDRTKPLTHLIKDRLYYQEEPNKIRKESKSTSSQKKKKRKSADPRIKQ